MINPYLKFPSWHAIGRSLVGFLLLLATWLSAAVTLPVQARPLLQPSTTVTPDLPGQILIGEDFSFTVSFDNLGPDVGYGPFIDLIFPYTGTDGQHPFDPGFEADGIDFLNATYLGVTLSSTVLSFPAAPGCVDHPYAVDSSDTPVQVCGTPGNKLVVLQLPFGSFVVDQPALVATVNARLSILADLNQPLTIQARGGYQFGRDPLDNPSVDPSYLGSFISDSTNPTLVTLAKSYSGPEDETATGPNYPRQYTITVDIAKDQPVTSLTVVDYLPNNMAFLSVLSTSPLGGSIVDTPTVGVAANPPDNDLIVNWPGTVTGSDSDTDASVRFEYFIPRLDANANSIIDPNSGDDVQSPDNAEASGTWDPVDPRDEVTSFTVSAGTIDHVLSDKSIAIQKGVRIAPGLDVGAPGYSPGDTLEYTLEFQISDYFTFGDIRITDIFSDGQRIDPGFAPTLVVSDRNGTVSGIFTAGVNLTVDLSQIGNDPDPATDGSTRLIFDVSQALVDLGAADGILQGGRAISPDAGPAIGTVVFRTVIQDAFSDTYPSGDPSVDHGDILDNGVTIFGTIRDNDNIANILGDEEDTSAASVRIQRGTLEKTIYAVKGVVCLPQPCTNVQVAPGDTVTYRLYYTLPSSDFEDLYLTDYLPLPIFDATSITVFNATVDATAPSSGQAKFGPADTFYNSRPPHSNIVPTIQTSGSANSVRFTYGDYDDPNNTPTAVDILFTVTVSNDPFADGLFLTNQVRAHEGSTNADSQVSDSIEQIQITQPVLGITKGVVYTDNPAGQISPAVAAPISFASGACPAFGGGNIHSGYLAATPINGNLIRVDAGDRVMFALVVENTGRGLNGAFDVRVRDALPAGFGTGDFVPGSLCVTDGTGAAIGYVDLGGGGQTDLFGAGIELMDPGPTDPPAGALDPGKDSSGNPITTGRNVAVITYELILPVTVEPRQVFTNSATLFNYAGEEGGADHTATDLSDDANVTIAAPLVSKTIFATNQAHTRNEPPPPPQVNVVIGEIVTYQVVVTVPEGTSTAVRLQDRMVQGLAFVGCLDIQASPGLSTSIGNFLDACNDPINPTVSHADANIAVNQGRVVEFNFGMVTNADTDNTSAETITIKYDVVVINGGSNDAGDQRNNRVRWYWGSNYVQGSAPNVRIYEPAMRVNKQALPSSGDAGDQITFSVTIDHIGSTYDIDAFDLQLVDLIPADTTYVPGSLNCNAAGTTLPADSCAMGGPPDTLTMTWSAFPLGQATVVEFIVTLDATVTPGQVIANDADLTWTSLPGATPTALSDYNTLSYERTGDPADPGGAENDHAARGSATVTITDPQPVKSIVATSEGHTSDASADTPADPRPLAIGEIVRYRMRVSFPEGTNPNVTLVDTLPDGLSLFYDETIRLSFIADEDISEADDLAGADNDADPPTFSLPLARVSVVGQTVTFDLGTLINNDRDDDAEFILLEFNVLVSNSAANNRGDRKDNLFSARVDGVTRGTSNIVSAEIVEPEIVVNKQASPTSGDAGDQIDFTVVISHSAGSDADAFDLAFEDPLPVDYTLDLASVTITPSTGATNNSSGNTVAFTITGLALGSSLTIQYSATLDATVNPDQVLINTAVLDWSSLPGSGTPGNPTGSVTPGNSGASDGERDGSGGVNDYRAEDDATVTIRSPLFAKAIVATSYAGTGQAQHDPAVEDLAIGETVTFHMTVTLPEGTTPDLSITDDLPDVLTVVSSCVVSIGANLSGAGLPISRCPVEFGAKNDVNFPDGLPDQVVFDFGTVLNAADGVDNADDRIVVEVMALVQNVIQNQDGNSLTNSARMRYGAASIVGTADVEIVEPDLLITKAADDNTPAFNQEVTYTIQVTHSAASTADAHDIRIVDSLPTGLTYISGSASLPPSQVDESGYPPQVVYTISELGLASGSSSFTYRARVGDPAAVSLGQTLSNAADLSWTSLPGAVTDERSGDTAGGTLPQNDYARSAQESVTVTGPDLRIIKDDGGVTVNAGDVIIYTLNFYNDGNSPASDVVIRDRVPSHATFHTASSSSGWSCSDGDPAGTMCEIIPDLGFGAGVMPAGSSGSVAFAITVDTPLPAGVEQIENTATISYDDINEPDPTPGNNSSSDTTPVLATPDLVISKADAYDTVSPGTILIYTISFSNVGDQGATGVEIRDEVPANTTFNSGASSAGWSCSDGDPPGTICILIPNIGFGPGAVPAGSSGTVFFALIVDDPFPVGVDQVTNTVIIDDDHSNGVDPTPGNNQASDTDYVVTFENADIDKSISGSNQAFTTMPDVAIGEILTYTVVLTVPPGSMQNARLTDVLSHGLAFLRCVSITPNSADLSTSLSGGFPAACSADPANPSAGNPAISREPTTSGDPADDGRRILFNLGDVSNSGSVKGELRIVYEVVVLDNAGNRAGVSLSNAALWEWNGGRLSDEADESLVVEPLLALSKSASPTIAPPGTIIGFTLEISHAAGSTTDAFDLIVRDQVPAGLTYIPGSLEWTGEGLAPEPIDDSTAPDLIIRWDTLPAGARSVIRFQARLGNLKPGATVVNTAFLEWSSLPGDLSDPQSDFNPFSTERYYDPPSAVDIYGVESSVTIRAPFLPETGFAPGVISPLPERPEGFSYRGLGTLWLVVPKIGVGAPIVGIPLNDQGWDLRWLWNQVGYLEGSAYPTWAGNTALTAHVVLPNGLSGPFARLSELGWGDKLMIQAGNQTYTYEVRQVLRVRPENLSVLKHEDYDWLTLITCEAYDEASENYLWRVVVRAVLVAVK